MPVKPEGLQGDIKITNVLHHAVKATYIFIFYIINQVSDF